MFRFVALQFQDQSGVVPSEQKRLLRLQLRSAPPNRLMRLRFACINDLPAKESDRKYFWPLGRRPDDHPGLSDLGF